MLLGILETLQNWFEAIWSKFSKFIKEIRKQKKKKKKERKKNIKGPRVTIQPSSRSGPRPSKQTKPVPAVPLSLSLTCGTHMSARLLLLPLSENPAGDRALPPANFSLQSP
jgi:hypothetical protein